MDVAECCDGQGGPQIAPVAPEADHSEVPEDEVLHQVSVEVSKHHASAPENEGADIPLRPHFCSRNIVQPQTTEGRGVNDSKPPHLAIAFVQINLGVVALDKSSHDEHSNRPFNKQAAVELNAHASRKGHLRAKAPQVIEKEVAQKRPLLVGPLVSDNSCEVVEVFVSWLSVERPHELTVGGVPRNERD